MEYKNRKFNLFILINIIFMCMGIVLAVTLGAKDIKLITVWKSIFQYEDILEMQLVRDVRFPRAICTLFAGGLLGISGAMMQGVTRNPVAEPSLMGISQGATLAIAILYASNFSTGIVGNAGAAFLGSLISGILVILFTLNKPSHMSVGKILLAGTAMSTFFISLASIIALLTNQSQMLGFWVAGGFRGADWNGAILLSVVGIICFIVSFFLSSKINIVHLGDDVATGVGVNAFRVRIFTLLLIIPMCAAVVSIGRNIAFVGLIIPQITKRCVGQDYTKIIPGSFLLGAVLLIFSDIFARLISSPYETPIGIFTSLIGIPYFIYLVRRER